MNFSFLSEFNPSPLFGNGENLEDNLGPASFAAPSTFAGAPPPAIFAGTLNPSGNKVLGPRRGCGRVPPIVSLATNQHFYYEGYPVRQRAYPGQKQCNWLSTATRPLNPYRWALDACEPYCNNDVCKEYGNKLAKYFDCKRRGGDSNGCQKPCNPRDTMCRLR